MSRDKSSRDLLKLQLAELEMLTSMYPNESEFRVDDPSAITDISDFADGKTQELPARLDFTINLQIEKEKVELSCSLPHDYPAVDPEVYVRSPGLDRQQQRNMNADLSNFLSSLPEGELRVLVLIQWLSDNCTSYINASRRKPEDGDQDRGSGGSDPEDSDTTFSRLWIYSHHIFNKGKRRAILELGNELQLTGFCLPGKPGIICAEGLTRDCNKFWQRVRHMSWKKIMLKKKETENNGEIHQNNGSGTSSTSQYPKTSCNLNEWRKFGPLQEVGFKPRQGPGREYHMDMGEFFRYLEQHQCGYVFKDYFGVDGKLTNPNGHSS